MAKNIHKKQRSITNALPVPPRIICPANNTPVTVEGCASIRDTDQAYSKCGSCADGPANPGGGSPLTTTAAAGDYEYETATCGVCGRMYYVGVVHECAMVA